MKHEGFPGGHPS